MPESQRKRSEIRNPKAERKPNSEGRNPKESAATDSEFRPSGFFRPSDFGFRISSSWPLALALVTFAIFLPALRNGFINCDDNEYITDNPHVRTGLSGANIWWGFASAHSSNWHPLTWLSHMLDCQLYGLNPWGHHLTSLLLHCANAALLFVLLQRLTGARWRSALVAALFAWHPLRVESVAWVAERKDVLSAFFGFLSLLAYARYAQRGTRGEGRGVRNPKSEIRNPKSERSPKAETRTPAPAGSTSKFDVQGSMFDVCRLRASILHPLSSPWYALALTFFACALLSKPMLVTLPFVMLLLDFWPLNRMQNAECRMQKENVHERGASEEEDSNFKLQTPNFKKASNSKFQISEDAHRGSLGNWQLAIGDWKWLVREKTPFFALSLLSCLVTFLVQQRSGVVQPLAGLSISERIANALFSYARYLGKLFWPASLAFPYPHPGRWPAGPVLLSGLLLAVLSLLAILGTRRRPYLFTGWLWYLGMMVPVIGLVQVGTQSMADHYTYLPLIGILVLLVWSVGELALRFQVRSVVLGGLAACLLVACAVRTRGQLPYWRDSGTLFRHSVMVTTGNYIAHKQLGDDLLDKGLLDEAATSYRAALQIKPDYLDARHNLGIALKREGKFDEAVECFLIAWQAKPGYAKALNNLGCELAGSGHYQSAVSCFTAALMANPDFTEARNNLGSALLAQGRWNQAADNYREALRLTPRSTDTFYNLGYALAAGGQYLEAITNYQAALRLAPDQALVHCQLARALAATGRREEAATHLREALRLKPDYAEAKEQLRELKQ